MKNSGVKSDKPPEEIVLALCAPERMKIENPISNHFNLHGKEGRGGGAATAVVYKMSDVLRACRNLLGLKLPGCAVILKGIVVVEGEINRIRRCSKFILRMRETNRVRVVWRGEVAKPSFSKFSILHCNSEVAIRKFFDQRASPYWELIEKFSC